MVRGLDIFRDHFESQADKYVLIGGTACYLAMREMGLDFRATRDLDIVLCAERIDADFSRVFWDFIQKGKYRNRQESTGKKLFYRFYGPGDVVYPHMIELFSRQPDALKIDEESHLTPIPFDDEASSLSAILLNEDYYSFILSGKQFVKGLPIVSVEFLIPLKARAYLDLIERQREGKLVNEKDIRKHKNDVFRLYQILSPESRLSIPELVATDMQRFLEKIVLETVDFKSLGLRNTEQRVVEENLYKIYGLRA